MFLGSFVGSNVKVTGEFQRKGGGLRGGLRQVAMSELGEPRETRMGKGRQEHR